MSIRRALRCGLVVVASALAVMPAVAATYTLDDLVNGASFQSDLGLLTFSDFSVTKLKKLSGNLSLYTVTTTADGFVLTSSAFTANSGGLKKLNLEYTVSSNSGLITAATMNMDASRQTGRIKVEKDIEDPASDEGTFLLTLLTGSTSILSDSDAFSPGVQSFDVEEAIRIKKVSTLNSIANSYTVTVPEPPVLSLMALGVTGLVWLGRRPRASSR